MLSDLDFPDIKPGEIDTRSVDFTLRAGVEGTLSSATWGCLVSSLSTMQDATPELRLIGDPVIAGLSTTQAFGTMINGVVYSIQIAGTFVDGRILVENRNISCNEEATLPPPPDANTLTPTRFKKDFPAFDNMFYTVESIQFWINIALLRLRETRWMSLYLYAQELFVAHELTLERYNEVLASKNSGLVPLGIGPANSRSVGGVSVSYDNHLGADPGAGYNSYYNLTLYGQRLWQLINIYGAGPIYIGGPLFNQGMPQWTGPGWAGPNWPTSH